jgi:hypothetical protein
MTLLQQVMRIAEGTCRIILRHNITYAPDQRRHGLPNRGQSGLSGLKPPRNQNCESHWIWFLTYEVPCNAVEAEERRPQLVDIGDRLIHRERRDIL